MRKSRPVRSLLAVTATAVLLSGCGAAAPGTAFSMGDREVSKREVDLAARAICSVEEEGLRSEGRQIPMSLVRRVAASLWGQRLVAEAVADEYDITPGATYRRDRNRWETAAEEMPADQRRPFVDAASAEALTYDVTLQAGRQALASEGVRNPGEQDALARGDEIVAQWSREADVSVDPVYGLRWEEGEFVGADSGSSVAVSPGSVAQATGEIAPDDLAALPETQRCG